MLNWPSYMQSDATRQTPPKRSKTPSSFRRTLNYFDGIKIKDREIHVRATGQQIPIDRKLFGSVVAVMRVYIYLYGVKVFRWLRRSKSVGDIAFVPHKPAFWYNIWIDVQISGLRLNEDPDSSDFVFVFEDSTTNAFDAASLPEHTVRINHRINDVSKTHVGTVFERVFGYPISIDPLTFTGAGIRKSNENGVHDGKVLQFPIRADQVMPQFVYQRLVASTFQPGISEDLRVAYAMGTIAVVYHKFKAVDKRFGTEYLDVQLKTAEDVFSDQEIRRLLEFCEQMGLDFGAIDVMRDKNSNRIYVVDVNKTCMPVLSLKFKEQMNAQRRISAALLHGLEERHLVQSEHPLKPNKS